MNIIINIYRFYIDGFKGMKLGKILWRIIFIKLAIIFIVLNYFVHDKSLKSEYKTEKQKIDFVYTNLMRRQLNGRTFSRLE